MGNLQLYGFQYTPTTKFNGCQIYISKILMLLNVGLVIKACILLKVVHFLQDVEVVRVVQVTEVHEADKAF